MNTINLIGNICNDLELKTTQSGKNVLNFNLAVKRPFTKDTTDFIPMVAWGQNADFLGKYGHKGSKVAVSGTLTTRKYQDKDGNNRTAYEVVCDSVELVGGKTDNEEAQQTYIPDAYKPTEDAPKFEEINTDDAMLPF